MALLDAPHASDVAVAGSEVVVTRNLPGGDVTVDAVAVQGGAVRRLLSVPSPRRRWHGRAGVVASAQRVAVQVAFMTSGDDTREYRLYTGPPAGPLRLDFRTRLPARGRWVPVDIDVDGDRVLLSEMRFRPFGVRLHVLAPGAPPARVPWSGPALTGPFALAGDHVAVGGVSRLFVADLHSGSREASIVLEPGDEVFDIDLAADGRLVAGFDGRLLTVAPGAAPAAVPGSAGHSLWEPLFAGSRIAALESIRLGFHPVVLDPGGAQPRAVGSPSAAFGELAADERGLAWIANGCVLYAPVDGAPPAEPPDGPCPRAEVLLDETDQRLHGRRVRIRVTCVAAPAPGCTGSMVLRDTRDRRPGQLQRGGGRHRGGRRRAEPARRETRPPSRQALTPGGDGARRAPAGRPSPRRQPEPVDRDKPRRPLVHAAGSSTHSGGPGPRLPAPGIRSRATSMLADAVHRQTRPGLRRVMRRTPDHMY